VGAGAFDDGLYETAYRELGRFIQLAPTDGRRGDAALLRGKAAFWLERYAEALAEFDAAETFPLTLRPHRRADLLAGRSAVPPAAAG
jgi:hypothetical protein